MADEIDSTAEFYRDLLIKLLGYGVTAMLIIGGWLVAAGEEGQFSLKDPNEMAEKMAGKGTKEYDKAFEVAQMKRDRAIGYIVISNPAWVIWLIAVLVVRVQCRRNYHDTVPSWLVVVFLCSVVLIAHFIMLYLVLKD